MAQETFGQIWNKVLLYAPGTPVALVQQFVRNAYNRVLGAHMWSELFQDGEKVIATEYSTGTVAVTNGSASITGSGTTWTSAMTGRQIKFDDADGQPYYTFTYVSATSGTLDRSYQGATDTSTTYSIGEYYVEFPSDLVALDDIRDIDANWRLRRQFHQQNYLDFVDPKRSNEGSPVLYVAAPPKVSSGISTPRFEFWPRIPEGTHIVYRYVKDSTLSANTDYPLVTIRPEALIYGALADLCLWPGSKEDPNQYFNLELHKKYSDMADDAIHDSEMDDLERSQRMLTYDDNQVGYPSDASFIQAHGLAPTN
jgi:hypothetical protein